jgi:ribose 5-phosphate isomerase B
MPEQPALPNPLRLVLGCDHAGLPLKEALKPLLERLNVTFEDLGTHSTQSTDYPDYAHAVASAIEQGRCDAGLLVCGTGLGMSMAANRHKAVRAAVCTDPYCARMTRKHNDANVLCLGARVIGVGLAEEIVEAFLSTGFEGGRHAARVQKIELA